MLKKLQKERAKYEYVIKKLYDAPQFNQCAPSVISQLLGCVVTLKLRHTMCSYTSLVFKNQRMLKLLQEQRLKCKMVEMAPVPERVVIKLQEYHAEWNWISQRAEYIHINLY